jgi:hypothetical protein
VFVRIVVFALLVYARQKVAELRGVINKIGLPIIRVVLFAPTPIIGIRQALAQFFFEVC